MILLKRCRRTETYYIKYVNLRIFSTEEAVSASKKNEAYMRKYLKPLSTSMLKPWTGDFVTNLFTGSIHKSIFNYPPVIRDESVDVVLNHSFEAESFIRDNTNSHITEDTLQKLKRIELLGLSVPQKYGGAGYGDTETKFLLESTGANPTLGRFLGYNEDFGCKLLNFFGNEKQKEKYLPKLAAGEIFISFAYLENKPLLELSNFEGHIIHDLNKKCYLLQANKRWVHNADIADLFLVMVKSTTLSEGNISFKLKVFIVDKKTPGVKIEKVLPEEPGKINIFEVTLDNVQVPEENLLGNEETDGFQILKFGLTHCHISDATLTLSILKQFIHCGLQFIQEKSLSNPSVKGHMVVQNNLTNLTEYTYALESVVYLLTGRLDLYESPDLFYESILAKTLAIEFLQLSIKKFINIVGHEALVKSGVLDRAVEALQYYTVFDENIEYLKLLVASDGLVLAAPFMSKKVLALRRPYDNYKAALKEILKNEMYKIKKRESSYKIKMEVHASLANEAENLERICLDFESVIANILISRGNLALEIDNALIKVTEMLAYIYASVACLSRASSAICYDFENFENDLLIAQSFTYLAHTKFKQLILEEAAFEKLQEVYRRIGKESFKNKSYPAEHPLSRTY